MLEVLYFGYFNLAIAFCLIGGGFCLVIVGLFFVLFLQSLKLYRRLCVRWCDVRVLLFCVFLIGFLRRIFCLFLSMLFVAGAVGFLWPMYCFPCFGSPFPPIYPSKWPLAARSTSCSFGHVFAFLCAICRPP